MSNKSYIELLKDPRWQRRRLEIMQRDEFTCVICYDHTETLNVHHLIYLSGKNPWEYEDNHLVTLCERCHKKQREVKIKNAFADLSINDSSLINIAFMLSKAIPLYVSNPIATEQAIWSFLMDFLKNNYDMNDELSGEIADFRHRYNG